ncbi:unnamed protein product, partial [Vitrella brassicaformis CCMP3155]
AFEDCERDCEEEALSVWQTHQHKGNNTQGSSGSVVPSSFGYGCVGFGESRIITPTSGHKQHSAAYNLFANGPSDHTHSAGYVRRFKTSKASLEAAPPHTHTESHPPLQPPARPHPTHTCRRTTHRKKNRHTQNRPSNGQDNNNISSNNNHTL